MQHKLSVESIIISMYNIYKLKKDFLTFFLENSDNKLNCIK